MSASSGYEQFLNDDEGYLRWLVEHPHGLAVNSQRAPASSYIVLHQASCKHISSPSRANWTTRGFIKTCSTDVAVLAEWARQATGGNLTLCGTCKPTPAAGFEPLPSRPATEAAGSPRPPSTRFSRRPRRHRRRAGEPYRR